MNRENQPGATTPRSSADPSARHIVVAQLRDRPNILERVVGLFRQRGYTIESLTWEQGTAPDSRRMEVVVETDRVDLLVRQLERLVDAIEVQAQTPALAGAGTTAR